MSVFESIVVTGTPFSGRTTLAKLLAQHFKWKFFSAEDTWREMWKKKYPKGDTGFENFMVQVTDEQHREFDKAVGDVLKGGHVVVDASYGFLYRDPQTLIIFTKCDVDTRVKRALEMNKYPGRDFVQVKEVLEQKERDEVDRCKALYAQDFRDAKNYDILFDTTTSPPDVALEIIMQFKP